MSRENVEIVRRWPDAWNQGDLDTLLESVGPDFQFHTARYFSDVEPVYSGREGFTEFWKTFREPWDEISLRVERLEDLGDRVLALLMLSGIGHGSGVETTLRYGALFTLLDAKAVRMQAFADWREALEAVGLSE